MTITPRKVCVVTGTRAEYGLLRCLIRSIKDSPVLDLQLIVTGMHLAPEFGLTLQEIESDGFRIDRKVEMLLSSDTPVGITKSMGVAMIGFADALSELSPDLLLVLGDRFETFAAASSALIANIPIAHCHGGEITEGAFDDALRHSITKMSWIHFVATIKSRDRVIQMGETPERVYCVGGLGVDCMKNITLLSRDDLEESLDFKLGPRNILVTFHPVTLDLIPSSTQVSHLLDALSQLEDTHFIITAPNSDTEGRSVMDLLKKFCSSRDNAQLFTSLGHTRYFSSIAHCDAVVGNSSSGLLEVPSFNKPSINIGSRQAGREKALSVIDCDPETLSIRKAIDLAFSPDFQSKLTKTVNPYGSGGAAQAIIKVLESLPTNSLSKRFHSLATAADYV